MVARLVTIFAPIASELEVPMPMLIYSFINLGTIAFIERLRKDSGEKGKL